MTNNTDPRLESAVRALTALSPQNQELVLDLIRKLADREGISMPIGPAMGLQTPAEGMTLWVAKLMQERYSKGTIDRYEADVKSYLKIDPYPTKLSIQSYLARRLQVVAPARANIERKAPRSFFGFLYNEGLWPSDPAASLRHIKVPYREKLCPSDEDITRLLREAKCLRRKDTLKFRTMVLLLVTTGLRIGEAASLTKENINLGEPEVKVVGKGGKERIVPMPQITAMALARYMRSQPGSSRFLFPGKTKTGHMMVHNFEKTLKRMCGRLGIAAITPHQLRHYFATYTLRRGAKREIISRVLGHSSIAVTADIYRHVDKEEMQDELRMYGPLNDAKLLPPPEGQDA